ncbi:hypothetical protein ACFOD0_11245 [Shewanella intestini]|uniref:ATP synthase subunit I n=1 Tax=Shewanella intestini TaxID=2017544 RepID=A0ABS5I3G7_9GAMM|nr:MULTISPECIES: hypothetical protein [Shewanella]MBR9728358.1 hypothetical protein [Shewanella intestini]MRG36700.1 hypothetical protein [Shewanella sp. XMDDZSB0408]
MSKQQQPLSEKRFWFERLSKTVLRALHIVGVVGAGGGILVGADKGLWIHYWMMAMTTGSLLLIWEVVRDWRWLIQLKGVLTLIKIGLLFLFIPLAAHKAELIIFIILLSVIVSHGPAGLRHYSIIHRKVIHAKKEIKG